jgi:HEAT repeat protein
MENVRQMRLIGSDNQVYPIGDHDLTVGRSQEADIYIPDERISRQHAVVRLLGGICVVQDLNSTNGVFVNERRVRGEHALDNGDYVRFGDTTFVFRASDDVEPGCYAMKILVSRLGDANNEARSRAANRLIHAGSEAVEALVEALRRSDLRIAGGAAWVLGRIGDPATVMPLVEALGHSQPFMRQMAAEALGRLHNWRAEGPLREALNDPDEAVRSAAEKALAGLAAAESRADGVFEDDTPTLADEVLVVPSQINLNALTDDLADPDESIRLDAVEALSRTGGLKAVVPLVGALKDTVPAVRCAAARGLGRIAESHSTGALVGLLTHDNDNMVRAAAVEALGWTGSPQAPPVLLATLQNNLEDPLVRMHCALALARLEELSVADLLVDLLEDSSSLVRIGAAAGLARLGDGRAVALLGLELAAGEPDERQAALEGLGLLGADLSLDLIVEVLEDQDTSVRRLAVRILRDFNDPRADDALRQAGLNGW